MKRRYLLALLIAAATLPSCGDIEINGPDVKARECPVRRINKFPPNAEFHSDIASGCTVSLPGSPWPLNFAINASFDRTSIDNGVYPSYYIFQAFDAYNVSHGGSYDPGWSQHGDFDDINVTGNYFAAYAGFHPSGVMPVDHLKNDVSTRYWGIQYAFIDVDYANQYPSLTITGPAQVIGWEGFTLNADLHEPDFVPPITYSWTQNGSDMGTNSDSFYYGGSPPDTDDDFVVTAVDLYGQTASQTHHVRTKGCSTPGCADQ